MNAYARTLPNLGFDPAPGDVDATNALSRRHHQVADELRQIVRSLESLDLASWEGQAANAARAHVVNQLAPAFKKSAAAAERLATATSVWGGKLREFQSEADALERKAAHAKSELAHQKAVAKAHPVPQPLAARSALDTATSPAADPLLGINNSAQDLHERYLAESKRTADEAEEDGGFMEKIEPYRKILEAVLAPLDIVAADHWIDLLEKVAEKPGELLGEIDEALDGVEALQKDGESAVDALIAAAKLTEENGEALMALPGWVRTAAGSLAEIRGLGNTLGALGIVADLGTVIDPPDKGAMGWVDRGAAGVNGGLIAANLALDEIPVAGEVVMIGTGIYLAGDFLYHNWAPFRNVCNDVGHATATAAKWVGHETAEGAEAVGHAATTAAKDTGHAISSGWHSLKSNVGSWF